MTIEEFEIRMPELLDEIKDIVTGDDLKATIGVEAVNHFKESFQNEGFTDEDITKWPNVQRSNPESKWFGHSSVKNSEGKYFSQAATVRPVLTGETGRLGEAIEWQPTETGVKIVSLARSEKGFYYGNVHQFGLPAKIYGKKSFQMPARPFMGKSKLLVKKINDEIIAEIKAAIEKYNKL